MDAEDGDVLLGDPGEIYVRGPNVFPGYWEDHEATVRALTPEGWLRTGDVAVIEDDGELRLVDRAKDLMIVSGFNVFPVEVEDVLRAHADIADAAVIGEPHARTGEAVVAYVVRRSRGTRSIPTTLVRALRPALARYKCPSRVEVVAQIPRNVAGKLLRRELAGRGGPPAATGGGGLPTVAGGAERQRERPLDGDEEAARRSR